jgi:hypothetical protein
MTYREHIVCLEKAIYDGDIPAMAQCIAELHDVWETLPPETQTDVLKLEAIFLSMLNARVNRPK